MPFSLSRHATNEIGTSLIVVYSDKHVCRRNILSGVIRILNCATQTDPRCWAPESRAAHSESTPSKKVRFRCHLTLIIRRLVACRSHSSYGKMSTPLKVTSAASNDRGSVAGLLYGMSLTRATSHQVDGSMCRTIENELDPMESS